MTSGDLQTLVVAFFVVGLLSTAGTIFARYAGQLYWRRRGLPWAGTDRAVLVTYGALGVITWGVVAFIVVLATRSPR